MKFNNRYITQGIQDNLPLQQQLMLWVILDQYIEDKSNEDYLQVFSLENGIGGEQIIRHYQEEPYYEKVYQVDLQVQVVAKIYIIDSDKYTTMMLAEEY